MSKHRERTFEEEVVAHLTAHGWLAGDPGGYDRELALYPEDALGWLAETQPAQLAKVPPASGGTAGDAVLARLAAALDQDGALQVLRRGFKHLNAKFDMCQFRPSQGLNPATLDRYARVRCRVVRQVRYSLDKGDSIDLVFFVNGIPIATAELKTDFTQNVHDAIRQYRRDRPPRDPATKREEPLLAFGRRAIVHFAVSTDQVYMATRLAGAATEFLPFNLGADGGAGNPVNPHGYRTAYLWERVLERDSLLDILGSFAHRERATTTGADGKKAAREALIFPRYHQWDAVRRLVAAARAEGPGQTYLIQHSAGSGKSNSIAWLAHRLASLHDDADRKVFDSVLVVTDRTVLDSQLQDTIYQFDHRAGVVVRIKPEGVKSAQLAVALTGNAPIVIVTLQTFPHVLDAIRQTATLKGRRYAVIADEAHSSQTGAAASSLARVLTAARADEEAEFSAEDVMLAEMEARAEHRTISYFAFTATPKAKTLERFGRRPEPALPAGPGNLPEAFHTYTMQQAIEEGFILDVLQNYTTYRLAFKLAHQGTEYDEAEVDRSRALQSLMRWVRLHPHNIEQKVAIAVEHFRENVERLLEGRAKAMIVTGSRLEAVRYKRAFDRYVHGQGRGDLRALVAFSGEVADPANEPAPCTEHTLNPGLKGRDIREAFASDDYRFLIVANKYQTGFDQPLLCGMYVDKRLDGITAVQTLSRLNRTAPGKDRTYVLDFVNEGEAILEAFRPYYRRAALAGATDPNLIHTLQAKLDGTRLYTDAEVAAFARAWYDARGTQRDLQAAVAPAVERFKVRWHDALAAGDRLQLDELELFRKDLATFIRLYDFLSQIINYGDTELESRSVYFRQLAPWLRDERLDEPIDLSGVRLTHYRLKDGGPQRLALGDGVGDYRLAPLGAAGTGAGREPAKARLAEVIQRMNELFEGDLTDADYLNFVTYVRDKMVENPALQRQAQANTKEQFARGDFREALLEATALTLENHGAMATQVLSSKKTEEGVAALLLDLVWERLRAAEGGRALGGGGPGG